MMDGMSLEATCQKILDDTLVPGVCVLRVEGEPSNLMVWPWEPEEPPRTALEALRLSAYVAHIGGWEIVASPAGWTLRRVPKNHAGLIAYRS